VVRDPGLHDEEPLIEQHGSPAYAYRFGAGVDDGIGDTGLSRR
jgi:hypothetical protein